MCIPTGWNYVVFEQPEWCSYGLEVKSKTFKIQKKKDFEPLGYGLFHLICSLGPIFLISGHD
jgi:hypothetical protein